MRFRPCIDLYKGRVVQIVGSTLEDKKGPVVNFDTAQPAYAFARRYREDDLRGGHVIMLGGGNEGAARDALAAWPDGLQVGGGITDQNAREWIEAGASHVIVTSYVFGGGTIRRDNLGRLVAAVGASRVVLDLSCVRRGDTYFVATDRWSRVTDIAVDAATLGELARCCSEFLVHAADVEGKRAGIDATLVALLADSSPLPVTYAGGVRSMADLDEINIAGKGLVDATVGSALDLFGGTLPYADVIAWHRRHCEG